MDYNLTRKNNRISNQSLIIDLFIWAFLILAALFILAPTIFMFTASLMPANDILKMPYRWIPKSFYWQNYWQGIRGNDGSFIYIRNILNSFIVASVVSATTVIFSALAGFGLAKYYFQGRNLVFMMIMATMMIPFEAIMIPLYLVTTKLGLQDSYAGLIAPFLLNAFGVFLMSYGL
ncbi:carbohydrate ABC transporter permease [Candidatus Infernicultor aquiphilus]|uniref:carbohydrate ABC transporter permease n=1 Tax=Candidatus Infernicultor aquiphilus TaxID=1805029 RepID=UPI002687F6BE